MTRPDFKCYDLEDLDFDLLDPGIRKTVEWLVDMGFDTTDSGDGDYKAAFLKDGEFMDQPHVFMQVDKNDLIDESDRLHKLLIFHHRIIVEEATQDQKHPNIQALYDPSDDSACIALYNVDDSMLFEPACIAAAEANIEEENIEDAEIIAETPSEASEAAAALEELDRMVSEEPPEEATGC